MRKMLFALGLLVSVASAQSKRPAKPITYIVDLTRPGDKKPTLLLVKLPEKFWQHSDHPPAWAPGTAVRHGWGTAWIVSEDFFSNIYQTHVFLEIEELGERKLKTAVNNYRKAIPDICKRGLEKLRGKVGKVKRAKKFRLGRKKRAAYTIGYKITPQGVAGNVTDVTTALLFEVNGYLVVLTVVKMGLTDYLPVVSKAFAVTEKWPTKTVPFKLIDLTDGVAKFLTFDIPGELHRDYRYEHGRTDARWELRGKNGESLARLALAVAQLDGASVPDYVKKRGAAYKDLYDNVSAPREVKVGTRKGLWLTFADESKEEDAQVRHVCKAFFKLHRYVWIWTLETLGEDPKRVAAAPKLLERILGSAVLWRSRIE